MKRENGKERPGELLPCVEVTHPPRATGAPPGASVIWLHGLGADGHDFEPIVPYLGLPADLVVRFVFPHAPKRAVTLNMGLIMPAWYDIRVNDLRREHDETGIRDSATRVTALIDREKERGVPAGRIVLAGFSQGGALALHVGLRHPERLAGIMALSCYLACEENLESEISETGRALPIFQAHGTQDPMVPLERGREAHDRLSALGCPVEWHTYPMAHEIHPQEIQEIGAWLARRLGPTRSG